jgi:hypothetical protein
MSVLYFFAMFVMFFPILALHVICLANHAGETTGTVLEVV